MPRPRGDDWLEGEVANWANRGVQVVVSLLEKPEIDELGLRNEEVHCKRHQLDFILFPIRDRGLPSDPQAVSYLILDLRTKLDQGRSIVIHCRMGIGRSSIIAGAVLLDNGLTAEGMLFHISTIRALPVPDTNAQKQWLRQWER
ncbi:protein-tyrosine phosphatase family protein [Catalinimonas alkaloidigena]|nr:protein-tyrosine phosphatase family protein [Catalinimonas alkaloidigena]